MTELETTDVVKSHYRGWLIEGTPSWERAGEDFDAWLRSVQAEAWREGAESAFYDPYIRGFVDYPDVNPYERVEETND